MVGLEANEWGTIGVRHKMKQETMGMLPMSMIMLGMGTIIPSSKYGLQHTPTLLERLKCESKNENNRRKSWGMLLNLHTLGVRGACQSSKMGTRMNDKWVK
jgi:hypothetical protein